MKITGKIRGDMVGFSLKHNSENGTRFAYVRMAYRADMDQIHDHFGKELALVAFGSMAVTKGAEGEAKDARTVAFGYKSLTPDAVCEYHEIKILGHTQQCQPVIKSITPIKDEEKVVLVVEFPILIAKDKELAGTLCAEFGELVDVELNPAQRELDLGNGKTPANVVIKKGAFGNPEPVVTG